MEKRCKAISDVGLVRQANEDSYLVDPALHLYAVADGMGGHKGGKTASSSAVEHVHNGFKKTWDVLVADVGETSLLDAQALEHLASLVQQTNHSVFEQACADPTLEGMGTTLTLLWFHRDRAFIAHVGDSRCYLFRQNTLFLLSEDHSWVQEQVRAGLMSPEQAKTSPQKNMITRSIGFQPHVPVDVMGLRVEPGDVFVLCSDGLSNLVEDTVMKKILARYPVEEAAEKLVEQALDAGGDDNVTVVCVACVEESSVQ